MSEKSNIEWCDSTVNFWSGCTKVSPGCAHCYAEARDKRHMIEPVSHWGKGVPRLKHSGAVGNARAFNRKAWICDACGNAAPLGSDDSCECGSPTGAFGENWHRRRIFANSLSDWLDEEVPIEWLAEMLDTIRQCDQVIWILCTKRPHLAVSQLEKVVDWVAAQDDELDVPFYNWIWAWIYEENPPKNIILLASVENQQTADQRIPELLKIPAVCRGLSLEPLLGPVEFSDVSRRSDAVSRLGKPALSGITWLIIGGESGPQARPCNLDWIASLVRQGQTAGVATFVKQVGSLAVFDNANMFDFPDHEKLAGMGEGFAAGRLMTLDRKGGDAREWPADLRVRQWPSC